MAKRPVPRYDFKAFGAAIKAARTDRKESRKKVCDEMFISPRYLANIENKGQHPSLQIFFELMLRYNISVDQFLSNKPAEKNTQRRQLDALLDGISDTGLRIVGSVVIFTDCSVFLLRKFGKIKVSSVVGIKGESFLASIGKGYPFRIFALLRCGVSD